MRILIYSDVHGNLPAFERMLKHEGPCDGYICLGDLVNYGPWSNECVDLAISLPNSVYLMGNHEEAFINRSYPVQNHLVKLFFDFTILNFTRFGAIRNFLPDYNIGKFVCVHTILNKYIYPDTKVELNHNYIIGHSHHQFKYGSNGFELYNAGSVGQNRKYINVASYLLLDSETQLVEMKFIKYNLDVLLQEMQIRAYPEDCLNYYRNKERLF